MLCGFPNCLEVATVNIVMDFLFSNQTNRLIRLCPKCFNEVKNNKSWYKIREVYEQKEAS